MDADDIGHCASGWWSYATHPEDVMPVPADEGIRLQSACRPQPSLSCGGVRRFPAN